MIIVQQKIIINLFNLFKKSIIFLLIFSIFNDVYLVDKVHPQALKLIFLFFIFLNINEIYSSIMKNKNNIIIIFYIYIILLIIQTLSQYIISYNLDIGLFTLYMISIVILYVFFSSYKDLNLIGYFIWFSVLFSIVLCFYADDIPIRKIGGTLDPNHLSIEVVLYFFISLYLYRKNNSKVFLLFSIVFSAFGILFAMSKSSILVLVIALIYYLVANIKLITPKNIASFLFFLVTFIYIASVSGFSFSEKLEQFEARTERNTAGARFHSFQAGLNMLGDNFISGVGFYEFKNNKKRYVQGYVQGDALGAHNLYIKLMAESGIIIFSMFIFFIYRLLSKDYIEIIKSEYVFLHLAAVGYLIMGMTLSLTYEKDLWLVLALLTNVSYNKLYSKEREYEKN